MIRINPTTKGEMKTKVPIPSICCSVRISPNCPFTRLLRMMVALALK